MRRLTLSLTLCLLVAACGGDTSPATTDQDDTVTSTPPATTPPTTAVAETQAEPESTTSTIAGGIEPPTLTDIFWEVGDYLLPNKSITNVWKTTVNVTINSDGTVTGNAGCNDYQGTWTVTGLYDEYTTAFFDPNDGQAIVFEDLTWGDQVCEDEDVMIQEGEILDILANTARWVLIEGNLSLRDSEGKFLLEATPA